MVRITNGGGGFHNLGKKYFFLFLLQFDKPPKSVKQLCGKYHPNYPFFRSPLSLHFGWISTWNIIENEDEKYNIEELNKDMTSFEKREPGARLASSAHAGVLGARLASSAPQACRPHPRRRTPCVLGTASLASSAHEQFRACNSASLVWIVYNLQLNF